jgi:predicted nucleic acid-binding protein
MIVLATNVVSDAVKSQPNPVVRAWLDAQAAETLYLTSIAIAAVLFRLRIMPAGKRKNVLAQTLDGLMTLFTDRVLAFDAHAAGHYAELAGIAWTSS